MRLHKLAFAVSHVSLLNAPSIQGTEDEVIDISHGKWLHSLCTRPATPMWAEGFNHQVMQTREDARRAQRPC